MRMRGADVMARLLDGQANRFDAPRLAYKARLTLAHNRAAARKTSAALAKACAGCRRQTAQHPPRCACAADTASPPRPGWQIPVAPLARRGCPSLPPLPPKPWRQHDADSQKKGLALGPSESQSESGSARDRSCWEQPAVSYQLTE